MSAGAEAATVEKISVETQALLFDMDGVLISSVASVVRCWRQWCRMYDVPHAETFDVPHGTRAVDVIRMLKPEFDEDQVARSLRVIEDLEISDTGDIAVLPGARELLAKLPPDRWAIVTSCTQMLLLARLAAAGLPVPTRLVSGDMVKRGKPDPEPYLRGAEILGFPPVQCVVVEDAISGVEAGVAAGCRVLAVAGTHPASELTAAEWVVDSLDGIAVQLLSSGVALQFLQARQG